MPLSLALAAFLMLASLLSNGWISNVFAELACVAAYFAGRARADAKTAAALSRALTRNAELEAELEERDGELGELRYAPRRRREDLS